MTDTIECGRWKWLRIFGRCHVALGVFVAILVVMSSLVPAYAAGANDEPVVQAQAQSMTAVTEYWTEARMKNAKPVPMPQILLAPSAQSTDLSPLPSGPTVIASSGGPGDLPTERIVDPAELSIFGFEPLATPGPLAFTGYQLFPNLRGLYQQFPYLFVGKVFFTIPGQGDYVCSGSVINAPNRSLVWTAGHCVYTLGAGWHTNFVFVPARHESTNPYAL